LAKEVSKEVLKKDPRSKLTSKGENMGIKSYLIELKTEFPVTIREEDIPPGQTSFEYIMERTREILADYDLNELVYNMAISSEVNDDYEDDGKDGNGFRAHLSLVPESGD
jgi:hypothetical protein